MWISHINDSKHIFGNEYGDYKLNAYLGEYLIRPILSNSDYFNISPESITVTFPDSISPYEQDFCITPNGTHNDLEVTIIPIEQARPGFETDYKIQIANVGNTILFSDLQLTFESELMDFISSSEAPGSVDDDKINWTFSEIKPFETYEIIITFELNTPTETPPLNDGDVLHLYASVDSGEEDSDPSNNIHQLYQTVVNSFDPNDKTCLEGDQLRPEMVGDFVHYMIRFENTGTAEAVNVVVRDSIDPQKFEISTLQIVDASHELETRINDGNIVEFIFKDIYLPFEDETNDGYVVFKLKTRDDLTLGDIFENQAAIYFDYNAPIITNVASTEIAIPLSTNHINIDDSKIRVFPNPTSTYLNVSSEYLLREVSIITSTGSILKKVTYFGSTHSDNIKLNNLAHGIYFVEILTEKGSVTRKIIKE